MTNNFVGGSAVPIRNLACDSAHADSQWKYRNESTVGTLSEQTSIEWSNLNEECQTTRRRLPYKHGEKSG